MKVTLAITLLLGYACLTLALGYGAFAALTWLGLTLTKASWISGAITGAWLVMGGVAYTILYHEI